MRREVLRLLGKLALLTLPLAAAVALYFAQDPFKVLYRYDSYYAPGDRVILNRDFVSTELFLAGYPEARYDSFILGNSRSLAFRCGDWAEHLSGARPFH